MLWRCERLHRISTLCLGAPTPPNEMNVRLPAEQQRHDPTFNNVRVRHTHVQPFGYDWNNHPIQKSRRSGRLFFFVFGCNRARRRQLRFLGNWVRDDTRCWRLWVPPVLAFRFSLTFLVSRARMDGVKAGVIRILGKGAHGGGKWLVSVCR